MPFYQKGDVRIRYEEAGAGFPLLVTPGGGLNSRVSNWPTAVFNAMEVFKNGGARGSPYPTGPARTGAPPRETLPWRYPSQSNLQ